MSKTDNKRLEELSERIGHRFSNISLLRHALCHTSYANEKNLGHAGSNERLEFLGDAVLELISSDFLYKNYPELPEGDLTKLRASLVCEPTLAYDARQLGLPEYLLLGRGEDMTGGRKRDSVVSDALEATIGAVYLDGGIDAAEKYIMKYILDDVEHKKLFYDCKTVLQEILQASSDEKIRYDITGETGPEHDKTFYAEVYLGEKKLGSGSGHSKKAAEQQAAYEAIISLRKV